MKKINGEKLCYGISGLLFFAFLVHTAVDLVRYDSTLNSAPFSLWVLVNGICFLLPAGTALIVGLVLRKKQGKHDPIPT